MSKEEAELLTNMFFGQTYKKENEELEKKIKHDTCFIIQLKKDRKCLYNLIKEIEEFINISSNANYIINIINKYKITNKKLFEILEEE